MSNKIKLYHKPLFFKLIKNSGFSLYPIGIFLKNKTGLLNKVTINKYSIQFEQQKELFFIGYYLLFMLELLVRLFTNYKNIYRSISVIREMKTYQNDLTYLSKRQKYNWVKYYGNTIK